MPTKRNKLYRRKTHKRQTGGACTSAPSPITISVPRLYTFSSILYNNEQNNSISTAYLEWTGGVGATDITYNFAYGSPPDMNQNKSGVIPMTGTNSYAVTSMLPNTTYKLSVTGTCGIFSTESTNSIEFTTPPPGDYSLSTLAGVVGTSGQTPTAIRTPTNDLLTTNISFLLRDMVLDKHGNLFINSGNAILKISPPNDKNYVMVGSVPTIISPPEHTSKSLISLYAGDYRYSRKIKTTYGIDITFTELSGMAYDANADCIYVSDSVMHQVAKVYTDSAGTVQCVLYAGNGDGLSGSSLSGIGELNVPLGLCVGNDGALYIADCANNRICKVFNGKFSSIITINAPRGVAILPNGTIYISSSDHCIYMAVPNSTGTDYTTTLYAGKSGSAYRTEAYRLTGCRFNRPEKLWLDPQNNLYIFDSGNGYIRMISLSAGRCITLIRNAESPNVVNGLARGRGAGIGIPDIQSVGSFSGFAIDPYGTIYIGDSYFGIIRKAVYVPVTPYPVVTADTYNNYSVAQGVSSAVAQTASSSFAQGVSSAVASSAIVQSISGAKESSAVASSAVLQTALIEPVAKKDSIVVDLQGIQAYLNSVIPTLYSKDASASDISNAKDAIRGSLAPLKEQLTKLTSAANDIFAIAPLYQDRVVQTIVSTALLEGLGYMRIYDTMRGYHIAIDSNGYIAPDIDDVSARGALSALYVRRLRI